MTNFLKLVNSQLVFILLATLISAMLSTTDINKVDFVIIAIVVNIVISLLALIGSILTSSDEGLLFFQALSVASFATSLVVINSAVVSATISDFQVIFPILVITTTIIALATFFDIGRLQLRLLWILPCLLLEAGSIYSVFSIEWPDGILITSFGAMLLCSLGYAGKTRTIRSESNQESTTPPA